MLILFFRDTGVIFVKLNRKHEAKIKGLSTIWGDPDRSGALFFFVLSVTAFTVFDLFMLLFYSFFCFGSSWDHCWRYSISLDIVGIWLWITLNPVFLLMILLLTSGIWKQAHLHNYVAFFFLFEVSSFLFASNEHFKYALWDNHLNVVLSW